MEKKINVKPDGTLEVAYYHEKTVDGVVLRGISRKVFHPGMDISGEDDEVKAYAAIAHTPEKVAAFKAKLA